MIHRVTIITIGPQVKTPSEIEINEPGTYNVRVSNTNGCFKDRTITVLPSNIATITSIEVIDASPNNSISIFVNGEGDYEYALDNSNGPYQDSNTFNNVQPGLYTVYVRDKNELWHCRRISLSYWVPKILYSK